MNILKIAIEISFLLAIIFGVIACFTPDFEGQSAFVWLIALFFGAISFVGFVIKIVIDLARFW